MSRLAQIVSGGRSQDIIPVGRLAITDRPLETEPEQPSSPVKTTLDLSCFTRFSAQIGQGRRGKWMSVNKRAEVTISHEIGLTLPEEVTVEFFLNRKGTILAMKQSVDGIALRKPTKTRSRKATCRALMETLLDLGVVLPVRFATEWDPELQAWVGRREG